MPVIKATKKAFVTVGYSEADYLVDGTADDVQIQAAADAAAGGVVFLKSGTYFLTNPIVLPANTHLVGTGKEKTILQLVPASLGNFNLNYMVNGRGGGTDCVISDIGFDGNYDNLVTPPANKGGLLEPQNGWIIKRCEFKTTNYFKVYIGQKSNITIRDCYWSGLTGAGNDCIGGGGNTNTIMNITIQNCRWASGVNGNNFDLVNGMDINFINNTVEGGCYFEGITDSLIEGNTFDDATLNILSNAGYNPSTVNFPRNLTIIGNKFYETTVNTGINLRYNDYASATTRNAGGGNVIKGNTVSGTQKMGILIYGTGTTFKNQADVIVGNKVRDPNSDSSNTFNSGSGVFRNAGIVLGYGGGTNGGGDVIVGNSISDTRAVALMEYGIAITGTSVGSVTIDSPLVTNNTIYRHTGSDGIVIPNSGTLTNQKIFNNLGSTLNQGGQYTPYVSKTADYTATTADYVVVVDATAGVVTITLPTAVGRTGAQHVVKKVDSSNNIVTVDANGSETIDGGLTAVLTRQYESITLFSNGSNWYIT